MSLALLSVARTKVCPRCKLEKDIEEFTIRQTGDRMGQPVAWCKGCNAEVSTAYQRQRIANDPSLYRRVDWPSKLKRYYGITVEDYYRILAEQGGGCALCGSMTPEVGNRKYKKNVRIAFDVDHDHKTGKVRGLLCTRCNRLVGLANDDPNTAQKLVDYLLNH